MDEECLRMKIFEIGETENVRLLGFDVLMIEICMSKEAAAYYYVSKREIVYLSRSQRRQRRKVQQEMRI